MSSSHAFQTTGGTTVNTTTETVIATVVVPAENQNVGDGIAVSGTMVGTTGAGTTSIQVRVRIGSLTGAVVGNVFQENFGAAAFFTVPFDALDPTTSYPAGQTYVITCQQVAATGNATGVNVAGQTSPCSPLAG